MIVSTLQTGGGKSENTAGELSPESRGIGTHNRKSLILSHCGFRSKTGAGYKCYSGFFRDSSAEDFAIITEAKADDSNASCEEAKPCILDNAIVKDITAIPISGKSNNPYRSSLFFSNRDYTGSTPHKNSDGRLCRAKSGRCGFRHLHGKPHYGAGGKLDCPGQR